MLVPGAEQNPAVGLSTVSYRNMKYMMLTSLPYPDLRDPTPSFVSFSFGPQRFADLRENADNIPASKNRNGSSRGQEFFLHPERHVMIHASVGGSDGKGNFGSITLQQVLRCPGDHLLSGTRGDYWRKDYFLAGSIPCCILPHRLTKASERVTLETLQTERWKEGQ